MKSFLLACILCGVSFSQIEPSVANHSIISNSNGLKIDYPIILGIVPRNVDNLWLDFAGRKETIQVDSLLSHFPKNIELHGKKMPKNDTAFRHSIDKAAMP